MKVVFGKVGALNWKSAVKLCIEHPKHAPYFVNKLWGYFISVPPDDATRKALEVVYVRSGHNVRPVLSAILKHPLLYEGPRMTKSPVVYSAGLLRIRGERITTEDWIWVDAMAGQQLFYPPNVSGWNDDSRSLGAALTVYGAAALAPRALDEAIARASAAGRNDRVLVTIFAPGGWDSLSLLYPSGDGRYRRLRPTLALRSNEGRKFSGDSRLHWHPSFEALSHLHDHGRLTVFPALGYHHPDQSHFTSRHFWEVGVLDSRQSTGWLGRLLDVIGDEDNAMQGLSLDSSLMPSLATYRVPVATLTNTTDYGFDSHNVSDVTGMLLQDAIGSLGGLIDDGDPFQRKASQTIGQADRLRRQLGRFVGEDGQAHYNTKAKYPETDFGRRLAGLAALLHAGFPIRAVALQAPGSYDTHSDQPGALANGAKEVADCLAAFQHDLELRHLGGRVVTLLWSEFGRRASATRWWASSLGWPAASTATATSSTTSTSAPSTRRCSSTGSTWTRTGFFRTRRSSRVSSWSRRR